MSDFTKVAFLLGLTSGLLTALGVTLFFISYLSRVRDEYERTIYLQSMQIGELAKTIDSLRDDRRKLSNLIRTGATVRKTSTPNHRNGWKLDIPYCGPRGYAG